MLENNIMDIMNTISYGFLDEENHNIIEVDPQKWDQEFYDFYYLLSPKELLEKKHGTCWDQVELERFLFEKEGWNVQTFFICTYEEDGLPCHTFLTYQKENSFYWFEHSWGPHRGIHQYDNLKELLLDVKQKFVVNKEAPTIVYEYEKPPYHISCEEYYAFTEKGNIIRLNEPLYFYHFIHQNVPKFEKKIPVNLSSEKPDLKYTYFFRYPPYKELGPNMKEILKTADIYRIDINNEEIQKYFLDIEYGEDKNHPTHKKLNKNFYETISKQDYFSNYDDTIIFQSLNYIGIAFKDGNCPMELLEKIEVTK